MTFSIESEINESLSLIDVKTFRENENFAISVFRKDTLNSSVLFHLSTSLTWYTHY